MADKVASQVKDAVTGAANAIQSGISEAKMDELIKAIDRLTDAVKSLAK